MCNNISGVTSSILESVATSGVCSGIYMPAAGFYSNGSIGVVNAAALGWDRFNGVMRQILRLTSIGECFGLDLWGRALAGSARPR